MKCDTRTFHHKLRVPKGEKPEPKAEMSPQEMQSAENTYYEASKWILNLSLDIRHPSERQAGITNGWVDELTENLQRIRSRKPIEPPAGSTRRECPVVRL
jgi:hypothetical protein